MTHRFGISLSLVAAASTVLGCATTTPDKGTEDHVNNRLPETQTPNRLTTAADWATPEMLVERCDAALQAAEALRVTLKRTPAGGTRTFGNTLIAYNRMLTTIENAIGWVALYFQVHPSEDVRKAAGECKQRLAAYTNELTLDRGLYDALAAVDTASLDAETERFVQHTLRDFRRSGVDKDEATRERLTALHARVVELGQTFQKNVLEDVRTIEVAPERLKGLPTDWIESHTRAGHDTIRVTTDYPDFLPLETYCEDEGVRRDLYRVFSARGYPANRDVMVELLNLRHEYAGLLGYPTWAQYNAETKMVRTAERVERFIGELEAIARPRMEADLAELLTFKRRDAPGADTVHVWDRFYYRSKVREERYGYDPKAVRAYFQYTRVKAGIMELYSELFGLEFDRLPNEPVWHPSVEAYSLKVDGKPVATFFLDMHPRDGKYKHAAMFAIRTGLARMSAGALQQPMASLVCNFPSPADGDHKAQMEHTQVVTFFHEFGHLLHQLLARDARWINLGGINVEWDFVEAPSQILEEWAWSPDVLRRFTAHVETGEAIPADLVARMRASEDFGKGALVMRQLFYAAYSFFIHRLSPAELDLEAFTAEIYEKYSPFPRIAGGHVYANFGHLIGYSSAYYTYQWSLVIAKDLFTRFKEAGLMSAEVARQYRDKILAPGGTRDANDLVEDFLGRAYNLDAYRAWLQDE